MNFLCSVSALKEKHSNPVQMFSVLIFMLISLWCTAWMRASTLYVVCHMLYQCTWTYWTSVTEESSSSSFFFANSISSTFFFFMGEQGNNLTAALQWNMKPSHCATVPAVPSSLNVLKREKMAARSTEEVDWKYFSFAPLRIPYWGLFAMLTCGVFLWKTSFSANGDVWKSKSAITPLCQKYTSRQTGKDTSGIMFGFWPVPVWTGPKSRKQKKQSFLKRRAFTTL